MKNYVTKPTVSNLVFQPQFSGFIFSTRSLVYRFPAESIHPSWVNQLGTPISLCRKISVLFLRWVSVSRPGIIHFKTYGTGFAPTRPKKSDYPNVFVVKSPCAIVLKPDGKACKVDSQFKVSTSPGIGLLELEVLPKIRDVDKDAAGNRKYTTSHQGRM